MKIITDKGVYVQKNDLMYLNQLDEPVPASIYLAFTGNEITIINDSNRYEFILFTEPTDIDFINTQDWIIDYDKVKDLTEEEFVLEGKKIAKEQEEIVDKYNSLSDEEKKNNTALVERANLLGIKFFSLRDILWHKQGYIKYDLPGEEKNNKGKSKKRRFKFIFRKEK